MNVDLDWVGVLRHGQSTGNVAREEAESAGADVIDVAERDADVPLTDLGREQASAAGKFLAEHPPDVVITSTYRRAWDTARQPALPTTIFAARPPYKVRLSVENWTIR